RRGGGGGGAPHPTPGRPVPIAGSGQMAPLRPWPARDPAGETPGLRIRPRRIPATLGGPAAARRPQGPGLPGPSSRLRLPAAPAEASPARAHLLDVVEARDHADDPVVEDGELLRQLLLARLQHGARHGGGG
ncbi:unnamed protein product, partial [Rangifer tarandus platyrhynchus]